MGKNVYHNGRLIPAKDWDYDTKLPKLKKIEVIEESVVNIEEENIEE